MRAVCERFGIDAAEPRIVSHVDIAMTADEQAAIMGKCDRDWGRLPAPVGAEIRCLMPDAAEAEFLARFYELSAIV